jgi:hypothetical protein
MPNNPFLEQSLRHLAEAAMKAAVSLGPGRKRSPAGQARLEERLKLLLIAVAHRLNPDFFQALRHDDESFDTLRQAGMAWVGRRAQESRYLVLVHAADKALGGRADQWLRETRSSDGSEPITELALRDDAGLSLALDLLATTAAGKRTR